MDSNRFEEDMFLFLHETHLDDGLGWRGSALVDCEPYKRKGQIILRPKEQTCLQLQIP